MLRISEKGLPRACLLSLLVCLLVFGSVALGLDLPLGTSIGDKKILKGSLPVGGNRNFGCLRGSVLHGASGKNLFN